MSENRKRWGLDDEQLLRSLTPQVLAALVRRYGNFEAAEDAVQEALLAASLQWPADGMPDRPAAWLITVASRRLTDELRSEQARRRREATDAALSPPGQIGSVSIGGAFGGDFGDGEELLGDDDTLTLLFLCCHPALSPSAQIALTLRAVGGLTTPQLARAFLVPEATMAQRISRAKQQIKAAGARFRMPPEGEQADRLRAVQHVLYLIFNEGYTATSGQELQRSELTGEAIRLVRSVRRVLPDDGEVAGLLALMLLIDARRLARTGPDGTLIPLAEQNRELWSREPIDEGVVLITEALTRSPLGPYQLQAAIAAVHTEATRVDDTDWPQILGLYELLERLDPNPMVTLSRAVAVGMVHGPQAGLEILTSLDGDNRVAAHHRVHAVKAHLLEMAGDLDGARSEYRASARLATNLPEQRYLEGRAAQLSHDRR